jgi:hypothetical protein
MEMAFSRGPEDVAWFYGAALCLKVKSARPQITLFDRKAVKRLLATLQLYLSHKLWIEYSSINTMCVIYATVSAILRPVG